MTTTTTKTKAAPAPETKEQLPAAPPEPRQDLAQVKGPPEIAMGDKGLILEDMRGTWWLATTLIKSGLAPKDCKCTEDAFIRMQMGAELGLPPMQAVQNIANINGRPSVWGDAVIGLVMRSKELELLDEEPEGTPFDDNYGWVCRMQRRGGQVKQRKFTVKAAKAAGLWNREGPWKTYPDRMLQMRSRSWMARDLFADVLRGLHIAEEVVDYIDVTPEAPRPKPARNIDGLVDQLESEARPEAVDDDPPFDPETGEILEADAEPVAEAPKAAKPERAKAAGGDGDLF